MSVRRSSLLVAVLLLLAGCAGTPLQYSDLDPDAHTPTRVELTETAFNPQEAYQCGPAALATVLESSGVEDADPDALAERVYLPERRGSLQSELLGATRRAGRVPYPLAPRLSDLLAELRAGHPVLVLQNLRFPGWPEWHYAVVVGYDLDNEEVFLRSGTRERRVLSLHRFERTWQLADYWAVVIPEPGSTPATATPTRYLEAAAALEDQERWEAARTAYEAARERWPDHATTHIALGNIAYRTSEYREAVDHFRTAITQDPEAAPAHYNLAWALRRLDREDAARAAAGEAARLAPEHPRYGRAVDEFGE
ncbi:MAG: PA2778 family cysteine peptidase [Pseudomonadota bacterium]